MLQLAPLFRHGLAVLDLTFVAVYAFIETIAHADLPVENDGVPAQNQRTASRSTDVGSVFAARLLGGADHDRLDDFTLLDAGVGDRVLDGSDDEVTHPCVPAPRSSQDANAQSRLGTCVVRDAEHRLLLDHLGLRTILSG